jgi:heme-degrading monooxygenase HmoA
MWIRLGTFSVKAGEQAALSALYNGEAVPKVRRQPGNLACLLLEPSAGENAPFVACTIWASQKDAEAYEASGAAQEVVGLVRQYFAGPPTLSSYRCESTHGLSSS